MKTLFTLSFTFLLMSSSFASSKSSCTVTVESWYSDVFERVFSPKKKVFKFDTQTYQECLEKAANIGYVSFPEILDGQYLQRNPEKFKVEFDVSLVKLVRP